MSYHDHDTGSGFHGQGRFAGVERMIPEVHEPVEMPQRFDKLTNPRLVPEASNDQEVTIVDNFAANRLGIGPEASSILQWVTVASVALVDKHSSDASDWRQAAISLALSGIAYLVSTSNERDHS
ncbi:MAG: hypothetical protein KBD51_03370 [Candidatus Levybacteria bacterium]|nr:hypothetical protein [Candidatus Levybacteria bacterium]